MKRFFTFTLLVTLLATASFGALANEPTTIRVWFADTAEPLMRAVNEELLPAFHQAHPDIRIEVDFIGWAELSPKLLTSFAGGVAPDLFMHGQAATAGFASSGSLEPLDAYIAQSEDIQIDFGASLDSGLYQGERYMMPVYGSGNLLVYRADFYEEVGLDPDSAPSNWDELREYSSKLAKKAGNRFLREGISLGTSGTSVQQTWSTFLWQNGGDLFSADGQRPVFNDAAGLEALEFYVGLMDNEISSPREAQALGNLPPLAAGTIAQQFTNVETVKDIENYAPDVYPQVRVASPLRQVESAAWYSFAGFFMSRHSENKDDAWTVLEFLTSPTSLEAITGALNGLPPRASLASAPHVAEDANVRAFVEGLSAARFNPNIPVWVNARDQLSRQLERAIFGRATPAQALETAEREILLLLQDQ